MLRYVRWKRCPRLRFAVEGRGRTPYAPRAPAGSARSAARSSRRTRSFRAAWWWPPSRDGNRSRNGGVRSWCCSCITPSAAAERRIKPRHIHALRQPGHLGIAELDNHPAAVDALRHVHGKEAAGHARRHISEVFDRKLGCLVDRGIPVGCIGQERAVKEKQALLARERHATLRMRADRLKGDVGAEHQALTDVVALQLQEAPDHTVNRLAIRGG